MDATHWFAVGTGISLGWVLCKAFSWVSPDGIVRFGQGFAQQLASIRAEKDAEITRLSDAFAHERLQWRGVVEELRSAPRAAPAGQGSPPFPHQLEPPAASPVHANGTTNGSSEWATLRSRLREELKLPADRVEAIIASVQRGDFEALQVDPLLQETIDGMIQAETKVL